MLTVSITSRRGRVALVDRQGPDEAATVPSENLVIEIEGEVPQTVTIDGQTAPVVRNDALSRGLLQYDAFRSVGFHRLQIGTSEFFFATEDAKLQLRGILSILDYVKHEGLSWRGPIFFSNGTAIRHPKIDHAWIAHMSDRILKVTEAISERPFRRLQTHPVVAPPGPGPVLPAETFSLLRSNPGLLEQQERGLLEVHGQRYSPRSVVRLRHDPTYDTVGNRRATHVLLLALSLCSNLLAEADAPRPVMQSLDRISTDLSARLSMFPYMQLEGATMRLPEHPVAEEIVDERYEEVFAIHEELIRELSWEPGLKIAERFAFVGYSDQIYQAFVALLIGHGFGTAQVGSALRPGMASPAFSSTEYDVYYDTAPPRPEFSSWRDSSSRPADHRPDLTIVNRRTQRGILLDAKYRVHRSGALPTSAIEEAQVYLQSFERKAIAICYPGPAPAISRVAGRGYTVLEISLGPHEGVLEFMTSVVRPALDELMEPLLGDT